LAQEAHIPALQPAHDIKK